MHRKYLTIIAILAITLLIALDRISYHHARATLYHEFPGLSELPVTKGGGLARRPGTGFRLAWFFDFYPTNEAHSHAEYCEDAQMWVSLTGDILETYPRAPGIAIWIRCVRDNGV